MPNPEHTARMLKVKEDMKMVEKWRISKFRYRDLSKKIYTGNGEFVAATETKARAVQIIQEHNSYDALVEALQQISDLEDEAARKCLGYDGTVDAMAKTALALAEKK